MYHLGYFDMDIIGPSMLYTSTESEEVEKVVVEGLGVRVEEGVVFSSLG